MFHAQSSWVFRFFLSLFTLLLFSHCMRFATDRPCLTRVARLASGSDTIRRTASPFTLRSSPRSALLAPRFLHPSNLLQSRHDTRAIC
ncbi:hypothetical protein DFP72DRAFT_897569 [Ephemerocybe angulata]|uniref:Secreted protein n=1 Tax=Ephemerocybe angulata TaxID=980116 RepID=A0A8H6I0Q9_9AGAR|nr:hypothetical protein DFP72DRAFT_897569 [Tulosesus angulatus]